MRVGDGILGVLLLLFGGAVVLHARGFPRVPGHVYGPGAFPVLIAGALVVCGGLLAARAFGRRVGTLRVELTGWQRSPALGGNAALALLSIVVYILFSERLGFYLLGAVTLFVFFAWLRVRLLWCLVAAAGFTLLIHYLFVRLLRIPLPRGVLHPILPW